MTRPEIIQQVGDLFPLIAGGAAVALLVLVILATVRSGHR